MLLVFATLRVSAQHEHHTPVLDPASHQILPDSPVAAGHAHHPNSDSSTHQHSHQAHDPGSMSHAFSLHLPMTRNGSGTGWLPDASPMYGVMKHSGPWMFMLHGNLFLRYNKQDLFEAGSRGDSKLDIPNWFMGMGQKRVGRNGLFRFSAMISLDAPIAGGSGYPLLFQSGETWEGQALVDRQHPHDLFSELSVGYTHTFSEKLDAFVYLGYPGEPALGPVAFMHRPSALPNPDATLGHHWTDATHITFGVATLGVRYGKFKLEGSSFTGREPDENRYDFDKPRFDSRSARLSFNPNRNWALQVSHAFVKSPELHHPGEDVKRTTASAIYSLPLGGDSWLNASAVWGANRRGHHDPEHSALLEASYTKKRFAAYTRYEWVQKSTDELQLDESVYGHHEIFPVHALTLGMGYDIFNIGKIKFALGGQLTAYRPDERLHALYGANPLSGQVYLRVYPGLMR